MQPMIYRQLGKNGPASSLLAVWERDSVVGPYVSRSRRRPQYRTKYRCMSSSTMKEGRLV